jgi:hypothetical protein
MEMEQNLNNVLPNPIINKRNIVSRLVRPKKKYLLATIALPKLIVKQWRDEGYGGYSDFETFSDTMSMHF